MSLCSDSPSTAVSDGGSGSVGGGKEIRLFGKRIMVDPLRKCVSLNNLSEYKPERNCSHPMEKSGGDELHKAEAAEGSGLAFGHQSEDDAVPPPSKRIRSDRKQGVPWTEEEHKQFLIGLQKVGKGDWRGISKNYVKTRTPTQVASHAQKYFLRRNNLHRKRRRSSLFDITTDSVTEGSSQQASSALPVNPPAAATVPPVNPPAAASVPPVNPPAAAPVPPVKPPAAPVPPVNPPAAAPAQPVMAPATAPQPPPPNVCKFSAMPLQINAGPVLLSMHGGNPLENGSILFQPVLVRHVPTPSTRLDLDAHRHVSTPSTSFDLNMHRRVPTSSTTFDLNAHPQAITEPSPLSWRLSLSLGQDYSTPGDSSLQVKLKAKDSRISVA